MSNTVEISLELAERLALPPEDTRGWTNWNTAVAYEAAKELRALLAAPVSCRECMGTGGIGWLEICSCCKGSGKVAPPAPPAPPAPVAVVLPDLEPAFEAWWESDGQYCRAGGGSYEKTFAYRAYEAAIDKVKELNQK